MEVNTKIKELEDEIKVLKAEIRNVLLDIREVILDRSNPLAEEHESAFIRMDLNTTARTMAAETAAHEANKALEAASDQDRARPPEPDGQDAPAERAHAKEKGSRKAKGAAAGSQGEAPSKPSTRAKPSPNSGAPQTPPADAPALDTEIPAMYRASTPTPGSVAGLAAWVMDSLSAIGPERLQRVISICRLWGSLQPHHAEALAQLQELIQSSEELDPPWLRVLQDLDRLTAR